MHATVGSRSGGFSPSTWYSPVERLHGVSFLRCQPLPCQYMVVFVTPCLLVGGRFGPSLPLKVS